MSFPSLNFQTKIKDLSTQHLSYIQDTPDFLRHIQDMTDLPDNLMLVTVDVSALYTNINSNDAMAAVRKALDKRKDQTVPTDFIVRLLELVLKWNIFESDSQLYRQLIGFAMGSKCAPNVVDLFMAEINEKIKALALVLSQDNISAIKFYKRFLDDIFILYSGTPQELHQFLFILIRSTWVLSSPWSTQQPLTRRLAVTDSPPTAFPSLMLRSVSRMHTGF